MKAFGLSLLVAAGVMAADATQTAAQQTGGGWWGSVARAEEVIRGEAARREGAVQRNQRVYDPRYETGRANAKKGNGPPFCRNGQGHPTKGRQWCEDKGWGSGSAPQTVRSTRGPWSDVILGIPQQQQQQGRGRGGKKS